jgi:DMSO/TMAO reductase YedYZ molybdopterin-dependent catalytic subunit
VSETPIGRRAFLGLVGVGLSSLAWGGAARDAVDKSTLLLPEGVRGWLPFGEGWRIYAVNEPYPRYDARWRLRVDGLVARPLSLALADLHALPQTRETKDFHCVTGWSVSGVRWQGVRLRDLLAAARPLPSARALHFVSAEVPYADSLTLDQALRPDAMLAHTIDGAPLTRAHGAPARLVMPAMYGYKGVKWVERITLTTHAPDGYWQQRGYDRDAWIDGSNGR